MRFRMSVEAAKRALQAVNLMIDTGIGIMEAARRAGTSRRTIQRFLQLRGYKAIYRMGKPLVITPPKMSDEATERAVRAVDLIMYRRKEDGSKYGLAEAARLVGTSRRTINRYLKIKGYETFLGSDGKLKILLPKDKQMMWFIKEMAKGRSASSIAKELHTTVKTISKRDINGERYEETGLDPVIVKRGNRWVLNILPLYDHSLVVYGRLIGLGDNVQGDTGIAVEGQEEEQLEEVRSPDAPSIWWQIDFEHFKSTLEDEFVGDFWKDDIEAWLRTELELPMIVNEALAERLMGNDDVMEHAEDLDRIEDGNMKVSALENIMNRYHIRIHEFVNVGVDDNHPYRENQWISIGDLGEVEADGRFQIFFLRDAEPMTYPLEGPLELTFEYNLNDERA